MAKKRKAMSSAESEDHFRRIITAHLLADGFSEAEVCQLVFKTPPYFHQTPADADGLALQEAFRRRYQNQLPHGWYFEGLQPVSGVDEALLQVPARPVTFVVIPGIFGEFIDQLPFQSIVEDTSSNFAMKWQGALADAEDQVYNLLDQVDETVSLAEVVKIGSVDHGDKSLLNVIVLRAKGGSLETLGSLESNVEVYQRRLEKVFDAIGDGSDIYLVGYSRGLAVTLALVSALHGQAKSGELPPASHKWFDRVKGVVGLGGVFYGAKLAQDVMDGSAGATSELVDILRSTAELLSTVPDDASLKGKADIVASNAKVWSDFAKRISHVETSAAASGKTFLKLDLQKVFADETKRRLKKLKLKTPNASGIYSLVHGFFLKTFNLKSFFGSYNDNILAFKQLVDQVITGVRTLTPDARDAWWRSHELPKDLTILSITGTMPDAYVNDFHSPLWDFEGFGTKTSDYNVSLRTSFYDVIHSENTQINDSQVAHFASRYWHEMYPDHHCNHYYLGVLGTHHWGMAFPFMLKDDSRAGVNTYPRATLLKSVSSFISSLDR